MTKKTALILLHCTFVGWLVAYIAYKDHADLGGRMITQGMLLWIIECVPCVGWIFSLILSLMAIVNISKGDEDYHCPIIGNANWFKSL